MRRVRPQRRSFIDLRRITIGDYIVLCSSLLVLISLFLPWSTNIPGRKDQWAFAYSEIASVVVIVFFLATLFLVVYPALSADLGLPALPFSTPVVFILMASILVLLATFELGKYACVECLAGRGFGVWVAFFAAWAFLIGAVIKWGSRPATRGLSSAGFETGSEMLSRRR
jgi:hypothetical protein